MNTELLDLTEEAELGHIVAGAPPSGLPKKDPKYFIQQKLVPVQVNVGNVQGPKMLTSTGQRGQIQVVLPPTGPQTVNNNYYGTTISGFCGNSGPINITAGLNVTTNNNAAPQRQISGSKSLAKKAAVLDDEDDFVSTTPAVKEVYDKVLGESRKEDRKQFTHAELPSCSNLITVSHS